MFESKSNNVKCPFKNIKMLWSVEVFLINWYEKVVVYNNRTICFEAWV